MKACIVIPCRLIDGNLLDVTYRFLNSIDKNTLYDNYEVLIYNNNSEHNLTERLRQLIDTFYSKDKFRIIDLGEYKFNLAQVYNYSLKDSNAELFVFCNNDMEILNNRWLTNLIKWFDMTPGLGICIPVHDFAADPRKINLSPEKVLKDHGEQAFCVYSMTRNVIESIGGFDERFDLYYQDFDTYRTVFHKGYKILWAYNSIIKHYGERTTINHPKINVGIYNAGEAYKLLLEKKYN